jgi:hypothetical protein
MLDDPLLTGARKLAQRSQAEVRAAALLRIARVEIAFDSGVGRTTFNKGLDAVHALSGLEKEFMLEQAALVAAAVAPELLTNQHYRLRPPEGCQRRSLEIMLDHGHYQEAVSYLYHYLKGFPSGLTPTILNGLDVEVRLALLRLAIENWRNSVPYGRFSEEFLQLLRAQWHELPREEALFVVHEIVQVVLDHPDEQIGFKYNDAEGITSRRVETFFLILDILRQLDPALAESLIAGHEQLAKIARRYPNGLESIGESWKVGTLGANSGRAHSLRWSPGKQDHGSLLEYALRKYREDINPNSPNRAPRDSWPSTCAFRQILYEMGKDLGRAANVYLNSIPDEDLKLLAQIELAAAVFGLPKFRETERGYWTERRSKVKAG